MTKIYIDTNVFLDFYQSATDRITVFNEIEKHSASIMLTEQTVNEFRRNKNSRLVELSNNIKSKSAITIYTTALVQSLPEFKSWDAAKNEAQRLAKEVATRLSGWVQDASTDPIHIAFEKLVSDSTLLPTTIESIEKAKIRKILGNPPTSPDKHTVGDELIWETLLAFCREDLVIVSRDKTFLGHISLLRAEFEAVTRSKLVAITSNLSEAFEKVGSPSAAVTEAEKEIKKNREVVRYPYALTLATKCPECGGDLSETGYEGSDGDSMWWMFCTRCGSEYFPDQFAD